MPSNVNVSVPEVEVPTMAIFDGAEGSPLESIAQIATRSVALAGSDPPDARGTLRERSSFCYHYAISFVNRKRGLVPALVERRGRVGE
jgi:hypothetical protein